MFGKKEEINCTHLSHRHTSPLITVVTVKKWKRNNTHILRQ